MYRDIRDLPEEEFLEGGSQTCPGCLQELGLRIALKVLGKDTVVVNSTGCMTHLGNFPNSPLKVSWIHCGFTNPGTVAVTLSKILKKGNVLVYVGDGVAYDTGFEDLSSAISSGEPMIIVCANTGNQASAGGEPNSSTPFLAQTPLSKKGHLKERKNLAEIFAAHKIYVATASIGYILDYANKLRKAMFLKRPAFIDLFTPCPTSWGFDPSEGLKIARLAVETGVWPLYEIENNRMRLTVIPKQLTSVKEYLKTQKRYKHLTHDQINLIQEWVNKEWKALTAGEYWGIPGY
ncbi:MAG: thiamine pyrophosphate-dependent enzyme [archaeon]